MKYNLSQLKVEIKKVSNYFKIVNNVNLMISRITIIINQKGKNLYFIIYCLLYDLSIFCA